jgi:hypothetical protein
LCSGVADVSLHWILFYIPGADEWVQFRSLLGTPVPKELSKSSENVIVERLPNMVRKVTVLERLPERQLIPPPRERNIVIKSVKLSPESYPGPSCLSQHITGSKKRAKEHTSRTESMYSMFSGSYFKSMFCPIWDIHINQHFLGCDAMLVNEYQYIRGPCDHLPPNSVPMYQTACCHIPEDCNLYI